MKRPIVVFSGLTAAGKTTHASLLAKEMDVPLYSSSDLIRRLADRMKGMPTTWEGRWSPAIDAARSDGTIDDAVDSNMRELVRYTSEGVFDATFVPWLYESKDIVRLWIESDFESRVRKCVVSHLGSANLTAAEARHLVTSKDDFSRTTLRKSVDARFEPDFELFDIIVCNTELIPEATLEYSQAGISEFSPIVSSCVEYVLGRSTTRPASDMIIKLAEPSTGKTS